MKYYFAYGSNLHHLQMKRRCPNCKYIGKLVLHDYNLTFRSKYGAAYIEKKTGAKVYENEVSKYNNFQMARKIQLNSLYIPFVGLVFS